ncbi:PDT-domain-containing protein [Crepidotus variabilis]|uniref:prephenate dehydratase n=1 Tax=Crepidotus variabilis TaxID=179855 RepID=A0A9P6JSJ8_9AGAR|nr:PDT-domain-containing protein [Crepidotus variabilis]
MGRMAGDKLPVAILGPLGTYTHEAAFHAFGHHALYNERSSIADVFEALSTGELLGVVPHENSIFGTVVETFDLLRSTSCSIIGEVTLKVEHCLLVKHGVQLEQIKRVFSHEQALGQCRGFLGDRLPQAMTIKTPSTAAAAQAVLNQEQDCAAICSRMCATLFDGLEVLASGIQNEKSNFTQFYLLSSSNAYELPPPVSRDLQRKALIRVVAPATADTTRILDALKLSTLRISRRPSLEPIPFHSTYFVEVQGDQNSNSTKAEWRAEIETGLSRVKQVGAEGSILGFW